MNRQGWPYYLPPLTASASFLFVWFYDWGLAGFFFLMGILSLAAMGWDKARAITGGDRVPERALLFWAFLGGGLGVLLGMVLFNHKTRKALFRYLIPLLGLAQILLLYR